ncbi:MAG: host attachment family protein [Gemmobacter sp.]|nr:host attachment family protein [Gemmobacter sp.]
MAKLKDGTWVLVADSEKALILANRGSGNPPDLRVLRKTEQDNPPDREQGTDQPGRTQSSHGPGSSAYDETDWHELGKERFAGELADLLYKHAHASSYEDIVLIAAPDVLGNLRKALHKEVIARVVAEIPKGLTQLPLDQLEKRLLKDLEDAG